MTNLPRVEWVPGQQPLPDMPNPVRTTVPEPHYTDESVTLFHGDCLDVMATLPDASVDAICTDPPYGLGFMGREWDALPPGEEWAGQCLRVLKPGGHMLAFGGTRTWHRLAVAIEDAGFEIRDSIAWLYASGFPKSLDVSKAIDKAAPRVGLFNAFAAHYAERRKALGLTHNAICAAVGAHGEHNHGGASVNWEKGYGVPTQAQWRTLSEVLQIPHKMWESLIERAEAEREVLATRRDVGGRTVSIIGREGVSDYDITAPATPAARQWQGWGTALKPAFEPVVVARKPLAGTVAGNVLAYGTGALNVDGCRIAHADNADLAASQAKNPGRSDAVTSGVYGAGRPQQSVNTSGRWPTNVALDGAAAAALDEASRFFPTFRYEAKAPTVERPRDGDAAHPTVKPLDLMRWLVRLVTPPGGVVLDPFAGSGTTAEACIIDGYRCITIEREAAYLPLIINRLGKPIELDLFGGIL